jgi:hypothetical protein
LYEIFYVAYQFCAVLVCHILGMLIVPMARATVRNDARVSDTAYVFAQAQRGETFVHDFKQTLHALQGAKTGEPICTRQAAGFACLRHRSMMPKSRTAATII